MSSAAPDPLPLAAEWRPKNLAKRLRDGSKLWSLYQAMGELGRDLPEAIGAELRHAKNPGELQQRLVVSVRDYLAQFMGERQRLLDEEQAEVDSPEEYARVSNACGH